jgi:hypothetical protein
MQLLYKLVNRLLSIALFTATIYVFIHTKLWLINDKFSEYEYQATYLGIINSLFALIINFIYKEIAQKLNDIENHKYDTEYNF